MATVRFLSNVLNLVIAPRNLRARFQNQIKPNTPWKVHQNFSFLKLNAIFWKKPTQKDLYQHQIGLLRNLKSWKGKLGSRGQKSKFGSTIESDRAESRPVLLRRKKRLNFRENCPGTMFSVHHFGVEVYSLFLSIRMIAICHCRKIEAL